MSRDELEALVLAHQAELYRYVRYLGAADATAAEDLVQESFLAAFKSENAPAASEPARRAAWLRGIARNLFLQYCRSRRTSPVQVDTQALEAGERFWAEDFLRGSDGFEYIEALRGCMERLEEKPRRALDLFYKQKLSRTDVAAAFQMTENGIKSFLQRVRAALGDCIERRVKTEHGG
ncbi:MAG: sigma-70 family RNA polymerase sigma factor [Planctomycetes bacterium]|nr:sigma-70 family RNA polymerase sigma factor [Planctomycetota bacterium]